MKNQKVRITCYGKTYDFESNKKALDWFMDCFNSCDPSSSEAGRYMYIIQAIMRKETNITDEGY